MGIGWGWEAGMRACKTAFVRDSNIKWNNELEDRLKAVKRQRNSSSSISRSVAERNLEASRAQSDRSFNHSNKGYDR